MRGSTCKASRRFKRVPDDTNLYAGCELIRRMDHLMPLYSCDINPRIPDSYCTISPFKPNEDNDYLMLDRALSNIQETVRINIMVQPADISPQIQAHREPVCSLLQLDAECLVGLSSAGELLIWDWPQIDPVEILDVPPPAVLGALVRIVYWQAARSLVWPGQDGDLISYGLDTHQLQVIAAHQGDVYALTVINDDLLTIGRADGSLKCWQAGSEEPAACHQAPQGVVSAYGCDDMHPKMVLIDELGRAGMYEISEDPAHLVRWLAGRNYRMVFGPEPETLRLMIQKEEARRAEELAARANEEITRQRWCNLEDHYAQLDRLHYRHVALSLRGLEARSKNDFVSELRSHSELVDIIPHEHPGSESSLQRCAQLLESAWQLPSAYDLYRQLAQCRPDNETYAEAIERLSGYMNMLTTGRCVITPDIALSAVIESAILLSKQLSNRYLIESRSAVSCKSVFDADEFIEKYTQLCGDKTQMPTAKRMSLLWFAKGTFEETTTVLFTNESSDIYSHIELGMKFFNAQLQMILVPVVILNAGAKKDESLDERNASAILAELQQMRNDAFKGWLEMVEHIMNQAVRRLITQKQAERMRRSGAIRCN